MDSKNIPQRANQNVAADCKNDAQWRLSRNVKSPTRNAIKAHLARERKNGFSIHKCGSNDLSHLMNHRPVSYSLALSIARMFQETPELFDCQTPFNAQSADAFSFLFAKELEPSNPRIFEQPTDSNDGVMRGLAWLGEALLGAVGTVGLGAKAVTAEARCSDLDDYIRRTFVSLGYYLSSKNSTLTLDQAFEKGKQYGNDELEMRRLASRLQRINPDCLRYAMCGERIVGLCGVFPISDHAYEETIAGKRGMFDYRDEEILPQSRNLYLLLYAETVSESGKRQTFADRRQLAICFMTQVAMLLDFKNRQSPRYVSSSFIETNTQRLIRQGFKIIDGTSAHPNVNCRFMTLDRQNLTRFDACVLDGVHCLLRFIRRLIDQRKRRRSSTRS